MEKLSVAILGVTGMVGQRFVSLLHDHPWFDITYVAASPSSKGKFYKDAVAQRWAQKEKVPESIADMEILSVIDDIDTLSKVDVAFSALSMDKADIRAVEEDYAGRGVAVVSNNSAHRWTEDVPMLMPEVNPDHADIIENQRKNRGWTTGMIAVKPNCSIQSYVTILTALAEYQPTKVYVTSLQAISGAGKTFETWPDMVDNVIPLIGGEEEKSEKEPMRIWGNLNDGSIQDSTQPNISATCIRVPVSDGHMASVSVDFKSKPSKKEILTALEVYNTSHPAADLDLPSSPKKLVTYFEEEDRPQTGLDRDVEHGMGITIGRLREGTQYQWEYISLSHNTLRGAAGGSVLMGEFLYKKGYIKKRL